jgi:bifunctional DNA-binding transcriptional regulator/antitoxin component of YhaV-PrlF toxin-antitoxin module
MQADWRHTMIEEVTLRSDGNTLETTLPKAMTDRLALSAGSKMYAIETGRGILLVPWGSTFLRVLEIEERISKSFPSSSGKVIE